MEEKLFGIYPHKVLNRKIPLVRGFDDIFLAPHSRHTTVSREEIYANDSLTVLAESAEAGVYLVIAEEGKHEALLEKNGIYKSLWDEYRRSVNWKIGDQL